MKVEPAATVHLYSYETGVSLELPVGFEQEDEAHGVVVYDETSDDDPRERTATVVIRVVADSEGPSAGGAAFSGLTEAAASGLDEVLEQRTEIVDETEVAIVIGRLRDGTTGREVFLHQSAAAVDDRVLTVAATAAGDRGEQYRAIFDAAVRSMRFVLL